jgi:hypothetical protein
MRNFTYILFILLMTFLTACSSNEQENNASDGEKSAEQKEAQTKEETKEEKVEVDKGLLNVEITLPASMFEGQDIDTIIASAKGEGVAEVTKNEDGSLTYKMSKSKHKEMMKEFETSILETIEEMKTSGDYVSIKDITHNDSFSEFTMVVDKEEYENSMDGFAALGLGMSGMMYQLYNGVDTNNSKVTISMKDQATEEVFDEIVYPDALEETESK